MSHSAVVTVGAAALESSLERALKAKMRPLSKKRYGRLFGNYGHASTFAAKIDLAYAFDIITEEIMLELNKIRDIRNDFSHSHRLLNLEEEPMLSKFNLLKRPPGVSGPYAEVFLECATHIEKYLDAYLERMDWKDEESKDG